MPKTETPAENEAEEHDETTDEEEGEEIDFEELIGEVFTELAAAQGQVAHLSQRVESMDRTLTVSLRGVVVLFEDILFATAELPPGVDEDRAAEFDEQQRIARQRVHKTIQGMKQFFESQG
jgi:hypothetical protein